MIDPETLMAGIRKMQETANVSRVYVDKETREAIHWHFVSRREYAAHWHETPSYRGVKVLERKR